MFFMTVAAASAASFMFFMTVTAATAAAGMLFMMVSAASAAATAISFRLKGSCNQGFNDFIGIAGNAGKHINTALSQRNQSTLADAAANNSLNALCG